MLIEKTPSSQTLQVSSTVWKKLLDMYKTKDLMLNKILEKLKEM